VTLLRQIVKSRCRGLMLPRGLRAAEIWAADLLSLRKEYGGLEIDRRGGTAEVKTYEGEMSAFKRLVDRFCRLVSRCSRTLPPDRAGHFHSPSSARPGGRNTDTSRPRASAG